MQTGVAVVPSRRKLCPPLPGAVVAASPAIRVLHIEDQVEQAMLVRNYLSHPADCFSVEWVPTLSDGLNRLSKPGIDVVLLDLGLPELRGHRTHSAVRAAAPQAPVVILTADKREISRELAFLGGAAAYLVKDEIAEGIRRALGEAVRNRRPC